MSQDAMELPKQYPASDYDPRMVNTHRMLDVHAASTERLSHMLTTVLTRAQAVAAVTSAAESPQSTASKSPSGLTSGRFQGYQPEQVYRSVRSFTIMGKGDQLAVLLQRHFTEYGEQVRAHLEALDASTHSMGSGAETAEEDEEADWKRRRLCETAEGVASPTGTSRTTPANRCFATLVRAWRAVVGASEEIQTVWAPFASQARGQPTLTTLPRATIGSNLEGPAAMRKENHMLAAVLPAFGSAVTSVEGVLKLAVEGCVAAILADARASHPLPSPLEVPASADKGNEEEPSTGHERDGDTAALQRQQGREDIKAFTEMTLGIGVYTSRVQPAVVAALEAHYAKTAKAMYEGEVPCKAYFLYAQESMSQEKARAQEYLHPYTTAHLLEKAEKELLGPVGLEVVARDFATIYDESADAAGGVTTDGASKAAMEGTTTTSQEDTLRLVWQLLSRCAHVSRDVVLQLFRSHVNLLAAEAVKGVVSANSNPRASPERTEEAVYRLLNCVHRARSVIARSFSLDQRLFFTQLDESLRDVLDARSATMAEVLALFVDRIFMRVGRGELTLSGTSEAPAAPSPQDKKDAEAGNEEAGRATASLSGSPAPATRVTGHRTSVEEILSLVAFVCTHLPDVDAFEKLHWRDMGRRLLRSHHQVNLEAERCFLRIFDGICGNSYISKFEGMMRDMSTSETLTTQYKEWAESRGTVTVTPPANASSPPQGSSKGLVPLESIDFDSLPKGLDLQLQLITDGLWPPCEPLPIPLPPPMRLVLANVEQFYHRLFSQRLVKWQHQLSYGTLRARLRPGEAARQLDGTLVQCLMLLHLDAHLKTPADSMTVADLCAGLSTRLDSADFVTSLLGVTHDGFGLVVRERTTDTTAAADGQKGPISPLDRLRFNESFTFTHARMHIPLPTRVEGRSARAGAAAHSAATSKATVLAADGTSGMDKEEEERVLRAEGHHIQVAIVQFLKSRGTVKHEELVQHLQTVAFNFTVTMPMVKKTLDRLIDRGFMKRTGPDAYTYTT